MITLNICFRGEIRKIYMYLYFWLHNALSSAMLPSITHCRLNEHSRIIYWKIQNSVLGVSGYVV